MNFWSTFKLPTYFGDSKKSCLRARKHAIRLIQTKFAVEPNCCIAKFRSISCSSFIVKYDVAKQENTVLWFACSTVSPFNFPFWRIYLAVINF